jgi:predicted HTH transcriptional regulator
MSSSIINLLKQEESIILKFKESKIKLNKDIYDTVCSFSNRQGGYIILGVSDNNMVVGVAKNKIEEIKSDFITTVNNSQKIICKIYKKIITFSKKIKFKSSSWSWTKLSKCKLYDKSQTNTRTKYRSKYNSKKCICRFKRCDTGDEKFGKIGEIISCFKSIVLSVYYTDKKDIQGDI